MDEKELTQQLIAYLDDHGYYRDFITWAAERGYSRVEIDKLMDKIQEEE